MLQKISQGVQMVFLHNLQNTKKKKKRGKEALTFPRLALALSGHLASASFSEAFCKEPKGS